MIIRGAAPTLHAHYRRPFFAEGFTGVGFCLGLLEGLFALDDLSLFTARLNVLLLVTIRVLGPNWLYFFSNNLRSVLSEIFSGRLEVIGRLGAIEGLAPPLPYGPMPRAIAPLPRMPPISLEAIIFYLPS